MSLLAVAHTLACDDIKARAIWKIDQGNPPLDPVKRLLFATNYAVDQWLKPAYIELVSKEEPFTLDDAKAFGIETTAKLFLGRERFRHQFNSVESRQAARHVPSGEAQCDMIVCELFWPHTYSSTLSMEQHRGNNGLEDHTEGPDEHQHPGFPSNDDDSVLLKEGESLERELRALEQQEEELRAAEAAMTVQREEEDHYGAISLSKKDKKKKKKSAACFSWDED